MKKISVSGHFIPAVSIEKAVRGYMPEGRVVPTAQYRYADMLAYVYYGSAAYRFSDGTVIEVHDGDALYIPRGSDYYYDVTTERYEYIYVDFILDFSKNTAGLAQSFRLKGFASPYRALLERIYLIWNTGSDGYYTECMARLYDAFSMLTKAYSNEYASSQSRKTAELCAAYLQNNYMSHELELTALEGICGCSGAHIRRVFKKYFGVSPAAYLTGLRMDNAKALLKDTSLPVSAVAGIVGYKDSYYFSRVFRSVTGCSPSAWRRKA